MKLGDDDKRQKVLAVRPDTSVYDVGYGKPPAATRFKSGKSGNPRGRPKGSANKAKRPALNEERMKTILLEEAYRTIKVNEGLVRVTDFRRNRTFNVRDGRCYLAASRPRRDARKPREFVCHRLTS